MRTWHLSLVALSALFLAQQSFGAILSDAEMTLIKGKKCFCKGNHSLDSCKGNSNPCKDCYWKAQGQGDPSVCPKDGNLVTVFSGANVTKCNGEQNQTAKECQPLTDIDCVRQARCSSNALVNDMKCASNKLCQISEGGAKCRACVQGAWEGDWNKVHTETCR